MNRACSFTLIFMLLYLKSVSAHTELSTSKISFNGKSGLHSVNQFMRDSSNKLSKKYIFSDERLESKLRCAEIVDLPGAFFCISSSRVLMNETFTRMGIFWGTVKGFAPGTILRADNHYLKKMIPLIDGHNLPGSIIEGFLSTIRMNSSSETKLSLQELDFEKNFVRLRQVADLRGQYYVIVISGDTPEVATTVSHEMNHAKFYLDRNFREAVQQFWNNRISEKDKIDIEEKLAQIYNTQDLQVVIDEFQAYLLEDEGENGVLGTFAKRYRSELLGVLHERAGYVPIQKIDRIFRD